MQDRTGSYFLKILKTCPQNEIIKLRQTKDYIDKPTKRMRIFDHFPDLLPKQILSGYSMYMIQLLIPTAEKKFQDQRAWENHHKDNILNLVTIVIHTGMQELLDSSFKIRQDIIDFLQWDASKLDARAVCDIMMAYVSAIFQAICVNDHFKLYISQNTTESSYDINTMINKHYEALIKENLNFKDEIELEVSQTKEANVNELPSSKKLDSQHLQSHSRFYQPKPKRIAVTESVVAVNTEKQSTEESVSSICQCFNF